MTADAVVTVRNHGIIRYVIDIDAPRNCGFNAGWVKQDTNETKNK